MTKQDCTWILHNNLVELGKRKAFESYALEEACLAEVLGLLGEDYDALVLDVLQKYINLAVRKKVSYAEYDLGKLFSQIKGS